MVKICISNSANRLPIQARGPKPNGRYINGLTACADGQPLAFASFRNHLSGMNSKLFAKYFSSVASITPGNTTSV